MAPFPWAWWGSLKQVNLLILQRFNWHELTWIWLAVQHHNISIWNRIIETTQVAKTPETQFVHLPQISKVCHSFVGCISASRTMERLAPCDSRRFTLMPRRISAIFTFLSCSSLFSWTHFFLGSFWQIYFHNSSYIFINFPNGCRRQFQEESTKQCFSLCSRILSM